MIVVDASVVAASLVASAAHSAWAFEVVFSDTLVAPTHLQVEVAQMLRRLRLAGALDAAQAHGAHRDLLDLEVLQHPYEAVGHRVWELHPNVTPYDAAYVALAEALDVPLATLDDRLVRATGPTCAFLTPE